MQIGVPRLLGELLHLWPSTWLTATVRFGLPNGCFNKAQVRLEPMNVLFAIDDLKKINSGCY